MTAQEWAQVFRAGAGSVNALSDEASPASVLTAGLMAMAHEAEAIAARAGP